MKSLVPAVETKYGRFDDETFGLPASSLSQTRLGKMIDKRGQINRPGHEATCAANGRKCVVRWKDSFVVDVKSATRPVWRWRRVS